MATVADPCRTTVPPEVMGLLSLGNQQLRHSQSEESAVFFCRAYAMDPRATQSYVAGISQQALQTLVCTLEDFCVCGTDSNDLFSKFGIALSLEKLCDWILTPELSPRSRVAWSLKSRLQMQREQYDDVITTCTSALKLFSIRDIAFLLQRALAFLLRNDTNQAVKDFLTAFEEDSRATEAYIRDTQATFITLILDAFYEILSRVKKSNASNTQGEDQNKVIIKLYRFVLMLNSGDGVAYAECTKSLLELGAYKDAAVLLSDALESMGVRKETIQMVIQRAECYLHIEELGLSLNDYVTALELDEKVTHGAILSLSKQSQSKLGVHAKRLSDDLLRHCRIQSKLRSACCVDIQINAEKLTRAAGLFKILHVLDNNNTDALVHRAECYELQGKSAQALDVYNDVVRLRPKSSRSYCARAVCYLNSGSNEAALSDYNTALGIQPGCARSLCGRMRAHFAIGQQDKGIADLISAARAGVDRVLDAFNELPTEVKETFKVQLKSFLNRAMQKIKSGAYSEKDVLLVGEVLARAYSTDLDSHLAFVELLVSMQKIDEAQAMLIRFIQQNPGEFLASVHLAMLRMRNGNICYALDELTTLLRTVGQEKLSTAITGFPVSEKQKVSREAYSEGLRLVGRENDGAAVSYFTLAIILSPKQAWEAYHQRGKRYFKLKKPRHALQDFTAVLSMRPKHIEALCGRAVINLTACKYQEAVGDFLAALKINQKILANFLKRLPESYRRVALRSLEGYLQSQFALFNAHGTKSEFIMPLSRLLVEVDGNSAANHSTFADALFLEEDYQTAAGELQKAEQLSKTLDMCLFGRCGLAHVKLNDYRTAAQYFSRLSECDVDGLKTMIDALNTNQRTVLAREAANQGTEQLRESNFAHALSFFSVSVFATSGQKGDYLRMRCKCLERLRMYDRAIDDLSTVMSMGAPMIGDLCARANLHILNESLVAACEDFMTSFDMNDHVTLNIMESCPGRDATVRAFTRAATLECEAKRYYEALNLCVYGLKVDPENVELKRLKMKLEMGVSKCSIQ
ncbi:predicted protein [Nematostella vectensis]|uniref:Uncharacterized protein n=1 Tax=Nematostella vectensis TaxID=45351 RepID=A7S0U6_NEMVE|nr:predicted protein [Nematostella vectensis]|eukprot:XP_001634703.1 predicted protein [Nematostella vectensis]